MTLSIEKLKETIELIKDKYTTEFRNTEHTFDFFPRLADAYMLSICETLATLEIISTFEQDRADEYLETKINKLKEEIKAIKGENEQ